MTIYIVTGHLGSGKTLLTVRLAQRYLQEGKRVCSNITLKPEHLMPVRNRATLIKLPYIPTSQHLEQLGQGYEGDPDDYDESKFGLIILDEAGTWLNSRDWQDKGRRELFSWITHARKKGWDVALIVQDYDSLDAQIRRSVTEVYVDCSRLDRVRVPYIGLKLPRMHVAQARYKGPSGQKCDRWWTRGTDLFKGFRTRESVYMEQSVDDAGVLTDMRANVSLLSAWHLVGRYLPPTATPRQWALFLLRWFIWEPIMLSADAALRSGAAARKPASIGDDFSQLVPGLDVQRAMRVYAARKVPKLKPVFREPSKLVSHSIAAYRLRQLTGFSRRIEGFG